MTRLISNNLSSVAKMRYVALIYMPPIIFIFFLMKKTSSPIVPIPIVNNPKYLTKFHPVVKWWNFREFSLMKKQHLMIIKKYFDRIPLLQKLQQLINKLFLWVSPVKKIFWLLKILQFSLPLNYIKGIFYLLILQLLLLFINSSLSCTHFKCSNI